MTAPREIASRGREVDPERVEKVARAILDAWDQMPDDFELTTVGFTYVALARISARAALAADTGEAQQAVVRVRALLTKLDAHPMPEFPGYAPRSYAVAIRAALDGAE